MDYVVGSVAALVSGNVTPNRPRLIKRALTPTKHPASPNVTPKSEFVDDRSIFLSPSLQKKKAVVKKSPKRIFQNPDLESTENDEGNVVLASPKADKVKKHLEDDLDNEISLNKSKQETKSPKMKGKNRKDEISLEECNTKEQEQNVNENIPKKKKKKNDSFSELADYSTKQSQNIVENITSAVKSPNKIINRRKSLKDNDHMIKEPEPQVPTMLSPNKSKSENTRESENTQKNLVLTGKVESKLISKKKNNKRKNKSKQVIESTIESSKNIAENVVTHQKTPAKKNRNRKKSKPIDAEETEVPDVQSNETEFNEPKKLEVNPNAVTNKESDSEHESDDEIDSENEEINKKVFQTETNLNDESSDEDEDVTKKETKKETQKETAEKIPEVNPENSEVNTEDEIKRTLFVGNVPFSPKCKKEIKKIFNKHGKIETIRIRTVPVKDGRYTPKLAVIKNELHPERTTVNVYIRYVDEESVEKALCENNTVLNDHHLRVSRSSQTGKEHDPKCSIFIGNLPFAMEDEVLRQKFEKCGEIESVRIIRDKKTNAGKGFGYVNFASKDGVELALALTEEDLTIKNRIIRVKRCTQLTNKQKQMNNLNKRGFKNQSHQGPSNRGYQEHNQGNQRFQKNQGRQRENQGFQRGNQGGFRGNQGGFRGNQGGFRENQGSQRGNQGGYRGNQGFQRGNQNGPRLGINNEEVREGAHRRIMHKRKNQEGTGNEGPPNKMQKNINEPNREKKARKEFVGMTAEKKKKRKFDKGQKKKKALSEILTK